MPLPIGHAAIGWAAHESIKPLPQGDFDQGRKFDFPRYAFAAILANLPDIDVVYGLLAYGNGAAVHRGPTHSLLFALLAGYLASQGWRLWRRIPRYGFGICFVLIFSHVAADLLLTAAPVSLLWPLELHLISGHSGWGQVLHMVLFQSVQDVGIITVCLLYVFVLRYLRGHGPAFFRLSEARRRTKP